MRFDCVERRVASLFSRHARLVTSHPVPFIALPVLVTMILAMGFVRHRVIKDELTLYTPTDADARHELAQLERHFHIDDGDPYYAQRRFDVLRAGYVLVEDTQQGDVLNSRVIRAAIDLWRRVEEISVDHGGRSYVYEDICVRVALPATVVNRTTACVSNPLIAAYKLLDASNIPNATSIALARLRYPVTTEGWFIGHLVGGITINSAKYVVGAKAFLLPYQLRHSTPLLDAVAEKWELKLTSFFKGNFSSADIKPHWWTFETLASESARDREQLVVMMRPMVVAITLFTVLCCCVGSQVRSRPWLGLAGVVSAGMGIVSAVGALLAIGVPFTSVAYSMPFIVFSIGVDNVFILLSSWRKTPSYYGLTRRMSLAWRDAGVSITVTSLTDGLSFGVGAMTTFPSVRIFCIYAATAVFFVYVYQLTFFAGIMAVTSRRELAGRSCITFLQIEQPKYLIQDCGKIAKKSAPHQMNGGASAAAPIGAGNSAVWATVLEQAIGVGAGGSGSGGTVPSDSSTADANDESLQNNHPMSRFFRSTYADWLLNPVVRVLVIASFALYLTTAVWGCTRTQLGLQPYNLVPDDSYAKGTLRVLERYFTESGSFLHVYITDLEPLQTNNTRIWIPLQREIELYEHTEFTAYADSWLRMFMAYANAAGLIVTPDNFVHLLKNVFLEQPAYRKYSWDVRFTADGGRLSVVRFPVHMRYVGARNHSRAMDMFRSLAASAELLHVGVYSDFFLFAEQYNAVLPGTLTNIGVAGAAVIVVSLLLIPQPLAAFWVSLTIASINVGILGFMSLWGVHLDFISMVTIVMSIGFCVDFSAHIAYHFSKEMDKDASERLRQALYAVGTPILQSACSTILGVLFMVTVDSYVFRSFLKTIVLVIVLGAYHGLVVLPVLLTLLYCNAEVHDDDDDDDTSAPSSGEHPAVTAASTDARKDGIGRPAAVLPSSKTPVGVNSVDHLFNRYTVTGGNGGDDASWRHSASSKNVSYGYSVQTPPFFNAGTTLQQSASAGHFSEGRRPPVPSRWAVHGGQGTPQPPPAGYAFAASGTPTHMTAYSTSRRTSEGDFAAAIYDNPLMTIK